MIGLSAHDWAFVACLACLIGAIASSGDARTPIHGQGLANAGISLPKIRTVAAFGG